MKGMFLPQPVALLLLKPLLVAPAAGWRDGEGKPVFNWQQKLVLWQMREDKQRKQQDKGWSYDPGDMEGSL